MACALCVGEVPERYLGAALAAISDAVDVLVVNDNSGRSRSANVETLEQSAFAARGALHIERHAFRDFADMRNAAFKQLKALATPPDWVLFLDADEVHGEQVRYIAREILPRLGARIGSVDAYTYNFFGSYRWITEVARRFMFYRYSPGLFWVNPIHEKITGLRGDALVLPYVYHHYGNVVPPGLLARKHGKYFDLGNRVPRPTSEAQANANVFFAETRRVRPYAGAHPRNAGSILARLEREWAAEFAVIDAGFRSRRTLLMRLAASARAFNEDARVRLRYLEHPLAYRATNSAR